MPPSQTMNDQVVASREILDKCLANMDYATQVEFLGRAVFDYAKKWSPKQRKQFANGIVDICPNCGGLDDNHCCRYRIEGNDFRSFETDDAGVLEEFED